MNRNYFSPMNRDGQPHICYHSLLAHHHHHLYEFNRLSLQFLFSIHLLCCSLASCRFYLWIHIIHLHHLITINQLVLSMIHRLRFYLILILIPILHIQHHQHPIIIQLVPIKRPHPSYFTTIPQPIFIHHPLIQRHPFIIHIQQQLSRLINQLHQH